VDHAEVDRHPGRRVRLPGHRHLDVVVVAVLAIALAVQPLVGLGVEGGVGQPVPGAEVVAPGEGEAAHGPKYSTWNVGSSQRRSRYRRSAPSFGASRPHVARTRFSVVGMAPPVNSASRLRSAWSKRAMIVSPTRRLSSARSMTIPVTGSMAPRTVTSRT